MIEHGAPRPRFAVGLRGYDRAQVDSYIADSARWAAQAWGRITELEARLAEAEDEATPEWVRRTVDRAIEDARRTVGRFAKDVNAKTRQFDRLVAQGVEPHLDELRRRVEELEEERRSALAELAARRQTLRDLVDQLYGDAGYPAEPESWTNGDDSGSAEPSVVVPEFPDQ